MASASGPIRFYFLVEKRKKKKKSRIKFSNEEGKEEGYRKAMGVCQEN
jgi:hypothetical protein